MENIKNIADLANYLNNVATDEIDLSSLPVFGGSEPASTVGVFSWDEDSVLVTDRNGEFVVESR